MVQPADTGRPRRGVWMFPGLPADALVDAVVTAEQLGLDEVWIADEGVARDPLAVLAAAAGRTSTIRLAIGVTSPLLRHPGAIAASIATVDELSHGRATLGLGVGGDLALGPFDLVADRPVALLRDAITTVRAVHRGDETDRYSPPDHAMPARAIPIWVGARGPQLVRLAAVHADGLFVSGCTSAQHEEIVADATGNGDIDLAIYQTAVDAPKAPSQLSWDVAHAELDHAVAQLAPASIGLNLVQFADPASDPASVLERAAALLLSL